jgi:RNA polymerase sigma factor (sigma-70 family)
MNRVLDYLRVRSVTLAADADAAVLDRFLAARDEPAFAELVRRHGPVVWGACRRLLADTRDAEDVFQATFLVLIRRAGSAARSPALGPWLHKVATLTATNLRRGNRRRAAVSGSMVDEVADRRTDPSHSDLRADIDAALLGLSAKHRAAVVLCHLQGLSRKEAAGRLGWPEGTLSATLNRALAKLRARLGDRESALVLALAGGTLVPTALIATTVRTAVIYTTASGAVSPAVLTAAAAALHRFHSRIPWLVAAVLMAAGLTWLAVGPTERPTAGAADPPRPAATKEDVPALRPGKWAMNLWLSPNQPNRHSVVTIERTDRGPALTAVDDDSFDRPPKGMILAASGREIRITIIREGQSDESFVGLIDPTDATRILGSLWSGGSVDRATLDLLPANGRQKPGKPEVPAAWAKYVELEIEYQRAGIAGPGSPAEKAAREKYLVEVPKALRKLVADRPDGPFGHEAAMMLFGQLQQLKPTPPEIDNWAKAARRFAATHGPRFEAATVGRIVSALTRVDDFSDQARAYAVEADKLAKATGMPAEHVAMVDQYAEERTAWAKQPNPPAAGTTWTVTVAGRVTDAKGDPVEDAEVVVNNTQWGKRVGRDDFKAKTGPDGKYSIALKCEGALRLHVTKVWAEKRGFVRAEDTERHKLLPGQSAAIDFMLRPGEPFGGTLRVRPDAIERAMGNDKSPQMLHVTGPGTEEIVLVENGGKFELTLPPGTYTVGLDRGVKKLTWRGLKTGRTDHQFDEPPFRFTPETVGDGFDRMWKAMDRGYSYFTIKPDIDWAKLRDEYRPKAVAAKSEAELVMVLRDMLGRLKDGHVWLETSSGERIGTYRHPWSLNGNRKVILDQLVDTTECGKYAIVGKTKPDGFGYFLMTQQSAATPELVAKAVAAIEKLADAPGFIIDLRNANGGSEPLAQEVAQLFCAKKVVYAKSKFRNGHDRDEFTEDYPRELLAAKSGKPYLKPVVCLLGPGCVSSGEGFAKMLAALPHVTTVGLPTRGSSGNPGPVDVGETGLSVYFSRWVDMLPDGTPIEGKGVPVSVRVDQPAEAYKNADATLAKGLEVLRAKVTGEK